MEKGLATKSNRLLQPEEARVNTGNIEFYFYIRKALAPKQKAKTTSHFLVFLQYQA